MIEHPTKLASAMLSAATDWHLSLSLSPSLFGQSLLLFHLARYSFVSFSWLPAGPTKQPHVATYLTTYLPTQQPTQAIPTIDRLISKSDAVVRSFA